CPGVNSSAPSRGGLRRIAQPGAYARVQPEAKGPRAACPRVAIAALPNGQHQTKPSPTPSCTCTATSAFSTAPAPPRRSWLKLLALGSPGSRSPTTTACRAPRFSPRLQPNIRSLPPCTAPNSHLVSTPLSWVLPTRRALTYCYSHRV